MVSSIDVVVGVILAFVGVALLLFLFQQVIPECISLFRNLSGKSTLRRSLEKLEKLDQLLVEEQFEAALKELERSFLLHDAKTLEVIAIYRDHNHGLLNRCLTISEQLSGKLSNLAEVERLLEQRGELQVLAVKTEESFRRLASRRDTAGKEMPSWGKKDYESRLAEIKRELKQNESAFTRAIAELVRNIKNPGARDITYH